jgi:hypothetical protein
MFAGIDIDSDLLDPEFWDTLLIVALVAASAWLGIKFGPGMATRLGLRGINAVEGTALADAPCPVNAVEKIATALAATATGPNGTTRTGSLAGDEGRGGRRQGARRKGRPKQVWLRAGQDEAFICWVMDRGRGGLRIVADRLVPVGTVISVLPADAPPETPRAELEVRNCRRKGRRWHLGCRFTGDISSMVRLMLG